MVAWRPVGRSDSKGTKAACVEALNITLSAERSKPGSADDPPAQFEATFHNYDHPTLYSEGDFS